MGVVNFIFVIPASVGYGLPSDYLKTCHGVQIVIPAKAGIHVLRAPLNGFN